VSLLDDVMTILSAVAAIVPLFPTTHDVTFRPVKTDSCLW